MNKTIKKQEDIEELDEKQTEKELVIRTREVIVRHRDPKIEGRTR